MPAKRKAPLFSSTLWSSIVCVVISLVICSFFMLIIGVNPIIAYLALFNGAFGSVNRISEVLVRMAPLLLAGLAVAIPFKCGVINLGAEGQLHMGAIATTIAGLTLISVPSPLSILLVAVLSFIAGAIWALVPAILKIKRGISEVLTTIMLNYPPILLVDYLSKGPLKEPGGMLPETAKISVNYWLPTLIPGTRCHFGLLIGIILAFFIFILWRTPLGYEVNIIASNPKAAHAFGINVDRRVLQTMLLGGGIAGLVGMNEICGIQLRLKSGFSLNFGYTGVIVALLANLDFIGVIFSSLFFAALDVGSGAMQRGTGVPIAIVEILKGIVIIIVLVREFIIRFVEGRKWT